MNKFGLFWRITTVPRIVLLCFLCVSMIAQSQTPMSIPTIDPASVRQNPTFSGGIVNGFVFDENGNPVSCAIVTLWQDDQFWQHTKLIYNGGDVNPLSSAIYGNNEGSFLFGLVGPGSYRLTAEKNGYSGSADVDVANTSTWTTAGGSLGVDFYSVNITLYGYHVPVLSLEQQSYNGAVAGTLEGIYGTRATGANVSLWQNGQIVKMPENPQSSYRRNVSDMEIDYRFEHLAPGQYQVMAEYHGPTLSNDTVTANITNGLTSADIILSHLYLTPPPRLSTPQPTPTSLPVISSTTEPSYSQNSSLPTPPPVQTLPTPKPSPSPGMTMVMLSLGAAVLLVSVFRRTR